MSPVSIPPLILDGSSFQDVAQLSQISVSDLSYTSQTVTHTLKRKEKRKGKKRKERNGFFFLLLKHIILGKEQKFRKKTARSETVIRAHADKFTYTVKNNGRFKCFMVQMYSNLCSMSFFLTSCYIYTSFCLNLTCCAYSYTHFYAI